MPQKNDGLKFDAAHQNVLLISQTSRVISSWKNSEAEGPIIIFSRPEIPASLSSVKFGFEFAFDIYNGVNLAHRVYWGIWADASEYAEIEC
jgi:hypothetical protein